MPTQRTVFAPTPEDLTYLLVEQGLLLAGGQSAPGVNLQYKGPWSVAGAAMAGVCTLVWWTAEPADEAESAARDAILTALRAKGALYEGVEPAIYLMGQEGPQRPSDSDLIGQIRDARKLKAGFKVGANWYHSDQNSRTQQLGLVIAGGAGLIPAGLKWKTMGGDFVTMTATLANQIFAAAMASDAQFHAVGEQARAALAAGTLESVHTIAWPKGFGE
jgi:hypothetical protein